MSATIPFVRDIQFEYGKVTQLTAHIRRIIANNPSAFTYTGTGVYIIGTEEVAVIDPGPIIDEHFDALRRTLENSKVTHVFVTHSHMDHSPLAHPLAEWAGCKVYAGGAAIRTESDVRMEAGDDLDFRPHFTVQDGDLYKGKGWTLRAITTPGHTSNHVCYALEEEKALFSGDHIMGWSTTVISPPDGHMGQYLNSLEKVRAESFATIWPTHGPPITDPEPFLEHYILHRRKREAQILDRVKAGDKTIPEMVAHIYADIAKSLHPAACHSVLSHMIDLCERNILGVEGVHGVSAQYSLKD